MGDRQSGSWAVAIAAAVAVCGAGCSGGGGSGSQQQAQGGFFGLFAPQSDPNKELTVDQGHKLLLEIRKNPKRMDTLTPAERRFLAKGVVERENSR